ncbi:MAG: photosynthetic complex putative assembly protein PuhB [Pseudomonadota bacterium]
MSPFYDDDAGPRGEPVRGLPELLPAGERILWQGSPAPWAFAIHVFHIRFVLAYLVIMLSWRLASNAATGTPSDELVGIAVSGAMLGALGLLIVIGLAWATAKSALFTLTQKRVVLRYGVAIRKYVNLPFAQLASADLRLHRKGADGGHGDIAITPTKAGKGVGYIYLWPVARPLQISRPQPSMRSVPDAASVAKRIADAAAEVLPQTVVASENAPKKGPVKRPVDAAQAPSHAQPA